MNHNMVASRSDVTETNDLKLRKTTIVEYVKHLKKWCTEQGRKKVPVMRVFKEAIEQLKKQIKENTRVAMVELETVDDTKKDQRSAKALIVDMKIPDLGNDEEFLAKMGILIEEKQKMNSVTKKLEENPKYKKQIVVLNSQFVVADQSLYDKIYEDVNTGDDNELSDSIRRGVDDGKGLSFLAIILESYRGEMSDFLRDKKNKHENLKNTGTSWNDVERRANDYYETCEVFGSPVNKQDKEDWLKDTLKAVDLGALYAQAVGKATWSETLRYVSKNASTMKGKFATKAMGLVANDWKSNAICYGCGEKGHLKYECPKAKKTGNAQICYNCGTKCGNIARNCTKIPLTAKTKRLMNRRKSEKVTEVKANVAKEETIIGLMACEERSYRDALIEKPMYIALMAQSKGKEKCNGKCRRCHRDIVVESGCWNQPPRRERIKTRHTLKDRLADTFENWHCKTARTVLRNVDECARNSKGWNRYRSETTFKSASQKAGVEIRKAVDQGINILGKVAERCHEWHDNKNDAELERHDIHRIQTTVITELSQLNKEWYTTMDNLRYSLEQFDSHVTRVTYILRKYKILTDLILDTLGKRRSTDNQWGLVSKEKSDSGRRRNIPTYVDSGANNHVISADVAETLTDTNPSEINGVGATMESIGHATATFGHLEIKDALVVPDTNANLISVSRLAKEGAEVIFNENEVKVREVSGETRVIGKAVNGMYVAMPAREKDQQILCPIVKLHLVMGCLSRDRLIDLIEKNQIKTKVTVDMLRKIKKIECPHCKSKMMKRKAHSKRAKNDDTILSVDFSGPFDEGCDMVNASTATQSLTMRLYVKDNKSKHVFGFSLNTQQATAVWKCLESICTIYKKKNIKIKAFKFDNFTSFHSEFLKQKIRQAGIDVQYTAPYQPQQLQAEETNGFLDSRIRQMRAVTQLPPLVWPPAQRRAIIVRNATNGHLTPDGRSSYETFNGKPLDVDELPIFGSVCYYRDETKPGKHNPRGREGIYLGNPVWDTTASIVWDPERHDLTATGNLRIHDDITSITKRRIENLRNGVPTIQPRIVSDNSAVRRVDNDALNEITEESSDSEEEEEAIETNTNDETIKADVGQDEITVRPKRKTVKRDYKSFNKSGAANWHGNNMGMRAQNDEWMTPKNFKKVISERLECSGNDPFLPGKKNGLTIGWDREIYTCPPFSILDDVATKVICEAKKGKRICILLPQTNAKWRRKLERFVATENADVRQFPVYGRISFDGISNGRAPFDATLWTFNHDIPKTNTLWIITNDGRNFEAEWVSAKAMMAIETVMKAIENWPKSLNAARRHDQYPVFEKAVKVEIQKLLDYWAIVPTERREGDLVVRDIHVLTQKYDKDGKEADVRDRLALDGRQQVAGLDYDPEKVYGPVAGVTPMLIMFAICMNCTGDVTCRQADVKGAYLTAELTSNKRRTLMRIPKEGRGLRARTPPPEWMKRRKDLKEIIENIDPKKQYEYFEVHAAVYGLHQSGSDFGRELAKVLRGLGFRQVYRSGCIWRLDEKDFWIVIAVWVDDLISCTNSILLYDKIMDIVQQKYTLKHNTVAEHVLGMRVTRHDKGILLDSTPAIKRLIEDFENKFGKLNPTDIPIAKGTVVTTHKGTKTDKPYRNLLGGLSHYSNTSVPEIVYPTRTLSRVQQNPSDTHFKMLLRVVRYLKWRAKNNNLGINVAIETEAPIIEAWTDASHGTGEKSRSVSGFIIKVKGTTVYTASKVQHAVALSSAEAELYAAVECAKKIMWIRKIVDFCKNDNESYTPVIHTDSASLKQMCNRGSPMRNSRHILLRWHYLFDLVDEGLVKLEFIDGIYNPADFYTKALTNSDVKRWSQWVQGLSWDEISKIHDDAK